MLQYIKEYVKLWYNHYCWGVPIPSLDTTGNDEFARRSLHILAKSANPSYRAEIGGTWELVSHTSHFGFPQGAFWVRKGCRTNGEGIVMREEYKDGKLYKVQKRLNKHGEGNYGSNSMITEYIK
ncbi:NAD dependent DNA ligase subunit A [Bacillus phage SWEP1]|nr:NAD dependent DNA ligase subunit A [Bacillus phage SWEP1]